MQALQSRSALRAVAAPRPTKAARVASRQGLVCRADASYFGSSTNTIITLSTGLFLAAGRFGLAPTVKKGTDAGLKLSDRDAVGLITSDPAGFTIVDVLAFGALGHIVGVGIVLGLRAIGA